MGVFYLLFILFFATCVRSLILFWGSFFVFTLVFCCIMRFSRVSSIVIYNYLVLQELIGYLFLLDFTWWFPLFVILAKLGVSPFHFWVLVFVENLFGFPLFWFLIYHKLSYAPFLLLVLGDLFFVLCWGLFILYLQIFCVSSFRSLLALLSLESFSWLLLLFIVSFSSFLHLFFCYVLVLFFSGGSLHRGSYCSLSFILLLINYPLVFGFYLKFISLSFSFALGLQLIPLLLVFCSVISSSFFLFSLVLYSEFSVSAPRFFQTFFVFLIILLVLV